jgi:ketopantoate reductase
MLQDFEAGKSLELAPITAATIELAGLAEVDTPALRVLHAAASFVDHARQRSV